MGNKWRTSLDMYVYQDTTVLPGNRRTAIVRWPDGTYYPYTETAYGSNQYKGPAGIYEKLQRAPTGEPGAIWGLFTKDQTKFLFDNRGNLFRIKDRAGNVLNIGRSLSGHATSVTDSSGRTLTLAYGSNGLLQTVTDPTGRVWTLTYDTAKNLKAIAYPSLSGQIYQRHFSYDSRSNITSETDLRGKVWPCTYDSSDRLDTWLNPLGHTVDFDYYGSHTRYSLPAGGFVTHNYSSGQFVSEVDPGGFSTAYGYDGNRNMNTVRTKRGGTWGYIYDANGNVLKEQDPTVYGYNAYTHQYTYNGYNDLMSDTNRASHRREYVYNTKGNVLEIKYRPSASSGNVTTLALYTYDTYGDLKKSEPLGGRPATILRNTNGDVYNVQMPGGILLNFGHDTLGRLIGTQRYPHELINYTRDNWGRVTSIYSNTASSTISYDAEDNVTHFTDENGNTDAFFYDDAMRLTSVTNGRSDTETYSYNANGWVTSVINGRGKTRSYHYTLRGDPKKMTLPDGYYENSSFDANGNATAFQNNLLRSNGQQIAYTYNALDAVTLVNYPTTADVSFTYDILQRVYSMSDGTGTTYWNYDDKERLQSLGLPGGGFTYGYNSQWQCSSVTSSEGTTNYTYSYESLHSLTNPHGETTTWARDGAGRLSRQTFHNGSYTDYGYDSFGRNNSIIHKKSNGTVISQEGYQYDPVGNMTTKTVDGVSTIYSYDAADQLITETQGSNNTLYAYDGNGNRTSKTVNGVVENYAYDDGDKLLSAGVKSYTYDLAGRTKTVTGPGGTTYLWYDDEDRLTQITGAGPNQSYTYNGLDARRTKTIGGTTNTYKRMGVTPTAPVVKDSNATYTPGISERRSGVSKWSHQDHLGSTKALTNSSQSVTDTRQYDSFGLQTGGTGSTPTPFGFGGGWGYQSDETGLQLLGHRYYDPSTGRFLTRDPIKDGRNWYGYCDNSPISYIDPTGHSKRKGGRLRPPRQATYEELVQLEVDGVIADAELAMAGRALSAADDFMIWFNSLPPAVQRTLWAIFGLMSQTAKEAAFGPGAGAVGGTAGHGVMKGALNNMKGNLPDGVGLLVEESYSKAGKNVSYGTAGSIRRDVVVTWWGDWVAIFDHKFGKSGLTEARRKVLEGGIPKGSGNPPAFQTPTIRGGARVIGR